MHMRRLLLIALLSLIFFGGYCPVQAAEWVMHHGTGGFFERPDWVYDADNSKPNNLNFANASVHQGAGLIFRQYSFPETYQWVHYPIDVTYPTSWKRILFFFKTDSTVNAYIGRVDVWDGNSRIATFNPPTTKAWSGGPMEVKLALPGGGHVFRNGCNIILQPVVVMNPNNMDLDGIFEIYNVGISDY